MRLLLTLVGLLAITASIAAEDSSSEEPFFVKSLRNLHRGPPELPSKSRAAVETKTIVQKLDHFDESNTKTWEMRYMVNEEHYQAGGPIFIYIGGEWEISPGRITTGHFVDMAKEHHGILYYTEHRYYGESKPTSTITVDELNYLHVKQALADLAHFIEYQKETVPELANAKVIISGGSYSATMVVWFMRRYPELANGGWASSAPILAKVDFKEYKEVVGRAFKELGSQQCYNRIQNGIAELESMMNNNRAAEVKAMLKICNNFDEHNDLDVWSLFGSISNIFSGIAQYQSEGDIPTYCNFLMSFEDDLTAITKFVLSRTSPSKCTDFSYKDTLGYYLESTYKYGASRPWYYQTCNEYGWYQSSGSINQPFGTKFPAAMYTTLCADTFGSTYTNENIHALAAQTNEDFGGMDPAVKNVYMTHGALDPWNPMGHGELEGATVIPRASHCADFGSISDADSAEMRASKERLAELVRQWVAVSDTKNTKTRRYMRQLV